MLCLTTSLKLPTGELRVANNLPQRLVVLLGTLAPNYGLGMAALPNCAICQVILPAGPHQ